MEIEGDGAVESWLSGEDQTEGKVGSCCSRRGDQVRGGGMLRWNGKKVEGYQMYRSVQVGR